MLFHSTPESVLKGEITKLAIIECVIAVAVYLGIGLYFDTYRHYTVAVAVAPFMLFRTEASGSLWSQEARPRLHLIFCFYYL